jgi:predicted Rossmann-fold nucleotide-binding protein
MLRTPRVLVAGGSVIPPEVAELARGLGRFLMKETDSILVTGGVASKEGDGQIACDHVIAQAAEAALGSSAETKTRIHTVVPQHESEKPRARHSIGTVETIDDAETRTRRYAMVISSDAVVAMHGGPGCAEIVELAYMAKKPLILLPSTGGRTAALWNKYRRGLIDRLGLEPADVERLESPADPAQLLEICQSLLRRVLRPGCFIASAFEGHPVPGALGAISSAVEAAGYKPLDLKNASFTGSVLDAIRHQIESATTVVADLTDHRPNVYYEAGIAFALRKRTVLLIQSDDGRVPEKVPFDLRAQQIVSYRDAEALRSQLAEMLRQPGAHYPSGGREPSS